MGKHNICRFAIFIHLMFALILTQGYLAASTLVALFTDNHSTIFKVREWVMEQPYF